MMTDEDEEIHDSIFGRLDSHQEFES